MWLPTAASEAAAWLQGKDLLQNGAVPQAGHAAAFAQATTLPEANGTGSQDQKVVAIKVGSTSPDGREGRPAGPRTHKSRLFARNHLESGFQARAASPVPGEHEQRLPVVPLELAAS